MLRSIDIVNANDFLHWMFHLGKVARVVPTYAADDEIDPCSVPNTLIIFSGRNQRYRPYHRTWSSKGIPITSVTCNQRLHVLILLIAFIQYPNYDHVQYETWHVLTLLSYLPSLKRSFRLQHPSSQTSCSAHQCYPQHP